MTGPNVKEAIEDLDIDLISLGEVAGAAINIKKLSFHQNICEAGMTWYPTNYLHKRMIGAKNFIGSLIDHWLQK